MLWLGNRAVAFPFGVCDCAFSPFPIAPVRPVLDSARRSTCSLLLLVQRPRGLDKGRRKFQTCFCY
eukprot:8422305-Pyramimonas_sp.AAC.1